MASDTSTGLARSGLTRLLTRLGAVAVVLLGVGAVVALLPVAETWTLLLGAFLAVLVAAAVLSGARAARKTATPYWRG